MSVNVGVRVYFVMGAEQGVGATVLPLMRKIVFAIVKYS